jgi:hypothetical protein
MAFFRTLQEGTYYAKECNGDIRNGHLRRIWSAYVLTKTASDLNTDLKVDLTFIGLKK